MAMIGTRKTPGKDAHLVCVISMLLGLLLPIRSLSLDSLRVSVFSGRAPVQLMRMDCVSKRLRTRHSTTGRLSQ